MIIKSEHVRTDLLPYDFVRTNEVIVIEEEDEYLIISTKNLSMQTYHELQRHLRASFEFKICDSATFNEVLTTSFQLPIIIMTFQKSYQMSLIFKILQEASILLRIFLAAIMMYPSLN